MLMRQSTADISGDVWLRRNVKNEGCNRVLNISIQDNSIFFLSSLSMVYTFNWKK